MVTPSPSPVQERHARRNTGIVVLSIAVAGLLVFGAVVYRSPSSSPMGAKTIDDGPTLYEALGQMNGSVAAAPGGPWTLYTVYGIASPLPFDPNALGWPNNSATVNSCQGLFHGLTLWNGSIPLFNGTYNSGTAPFWQMFYFSNVSQSLLVVTDVMGVARAFPPISMVSSCAVSSGLAITPWSWAKEFSPLPPDSTLLAANAWAAMGGGWSASYGVPVETYRLGNGWWGGSRPEGQVLELGRCGLVGATAVQPIDDAVFSSNGSVADVYGGSIGCGNVASLGPPVVLSPYNLDFTLNRTTASGATSLTYLSLAASAGDRTTGTIPNPGGIVSWIVGLALNTSSGSVLEPAGSGCAQWVSVVESSCSANESGWYALLLSPNGSWLDSFGSAATGAHWSVPNVSIVSNQQLLIVYPSTWSLSGASLTASSTTPDAPLNGTALL
jgi:hypothetical protein